MLMGWGPFRFTVPNYSVEQMVRTRSARAEPQMVIGGKPPIHLLGPGPEYLTLESTFHPLHLNGRGLQQLVGVREAIAQNVPLLLMHIGGWNFGPWVATNLHETQEQFAPHSGVPQTVTVSLDLIAYNGGLSGLGGPGGGGFSLNIGGFSVSLGF